jgi:hypothetical protein
MIRQIISTLPLGELSRSSEKWGLPLIDAIRYRSPEATAAPTGNQKIRRGGPCPPPVAHRTKRILYYSLDAIQRSASMAAAAPVPAAVTAWR